MKHNRPLAVECGACKQQLFFDKIIARAHWTQTVDTIHAQFICFTPDCGNTVVLEFDTSD